MAAPASAKTFNRLAIHLAGHRFLPLWAVLRHRGRKSGKEYAVPVAVIPDEGHFIIALPWGRNTDWVRNTRAAGGCTVRWKGTEYRCTNPTFVGKDDALAVAKGLARQGVERREFPHGFLRLDRSAVVAPGT
jgi:deazaflavin-dependent oxidoreductase (nitroreductase family)